MKTLFGFTLALAAALLVGACDNTPAESLPPAPAAEEAAPDVAEDAAPPAVGEQDSGLSPGTTSSVTYVRYAVSGATLRTQAEWIDACALPGSTAVLQNAAAGSYVGTVPMPFDFTLYDYTWAMGTTVAVSANGAFGLSYATTGKTPLPQHSKMYTLFPFWSHMKMSAAGVCYGTTGAAPNRKFVITWTNADPTITTQVEALTFSLVLSEGTDLVEFLYQKWADDAADPTDCTGVTETARGAGAFIGAQGFTDVHSFASPLPVHGDPCPGNMYKVTMQPLKL